MTDPAIAYIRHVLEVRGWTAADLARHAGLAHSTINRPLTVTNYPNAISRKTISQVFKVSGIDPAPFFLASGEVPPMAQVAPVAEVGKLSFRDRMIEALADTGMSLAELARRSGVNYDALNKLKSRPGSSTSAESAQAIAQVLGFEWGAESRAVDADGVVLGPVMVPVFDIQASAGNGWVVGDYEPIAYQLAFPPEYLRRVTSSHPANLAIISVKGDSMVPTLKDDDIVMLDRSKTSLGFDGLFVLRFDDALHVKRVARGARKGTIAIISDNRTLYPPIERELSEVVAVGKVIWTGVRE